jgi:flagellar basal-body rod modification protein FlgD
MADAISQIGASGDARTEKAKTSLAADFDAFLLLLTTQLKHQDPLSPLEPTEFTGQLVQFASVEQQIKANENMEKLVSIQNAALASSIISFVGTDVEADGSQVPLQNGQAKFTYTLSKAAKNVVITLTDENGRMVLTKPGERDPGLHTFKWDGKDSNGALLKDGPYRVSVTPIGFDDAPVAATVRVFGHVTGVSMNNGTNLDVGGVTIPLDKIIKITEAED